MNREDHWNESSDGFRSDEGELQYAPATPRSLRQQDAAEDERERTPPEFEHLDALHQIPQAILQSSREGGNGSWQEGETSRQQQEPPTQHAEMGVAQTYFRIGPNGEREIIRVTSVNAPPPNQITLPFPHQTVMLGPPQQLPPHFPPSPRMSHPPVQKSGELKSLDNLRNVTQQSFAPSQKTIVLNHIASQMGGVYHSHVSTERMPVQPQREPNTRHSHVHDTRVGSPSRVSFDYVQSKPEAARNLFSSYIPTGPAPLPQRGGAVSTSNAPQPSERQCQHPDEVGFWREKYEQVGRRWQATRVKEGKEQEVALSKFLALEKNYQLLQTSYDQLVQDYHAKLDENQQYFQQIQQLQAAVNQLQVAPKRGEEESGLQGALQEKSMLVGLLRKQNEQFQAHLQQLQQRHQQDMREMHEHATMLQLEVEQRDAQIREHSHLKTSAMRRSDNSQLLLDRSRMDSFENTRLMELEMHVGKLNAELNMREESFERQLRMANLNVAELVEKLKAQAQEKDQFIRNLQEKVGLLESDLNKKDSLIRNLRDDAARAPAPAPAASVYSSAVNPVEHRTGDREQAFKRQLQNIRRSLFEREREKLILKQKYEQLQQRALESEQALGRRKVENQAMRRQLNDLDNLQHENEKLMEVLDKKNAELLEVKEMLMEKEQHAGDFENLSKENDRLRAFMLKKNEQLSELAERLYNQEKRAREMELAHSPQLHEMEEELQRLEEMLGRKDVEIGKLNQSLELVEGNFSEIEFELERHRNINQEYEAQISTNMARLQAGEEELAALEGEKHLLEVEVAALRDKMREYHAELGDRQATEEAALRRAKQAEAKLLVWEGQLVTFEAEQLELREFKQKSAKEIQQFESKQGDLQMRCRDLESQLRNREQRLVRAEREAQESREQMKKHQSCAKQIEQMTERISHYEMRVISLTLNRSRGGLTDYPPPTEIFENKLIYNLKAENESLRGQLASFKGEAGSLGSEPSGQLHRQQSSKGSDIKVRLDQFSTNLQSAIGGAGGGGLKRVRSVEALQSSAAEEQTRQIQRLKQLAQQMQQQQLESSFSRRKRMTPEHLEQLYQEELAFYRTNNSQLEQRVASLLRLNKDLKQQNQDLVLHKGASLKTFYEDELRRLEREVGQLRAEKSRGGEVGRASDRRVRELQEEVARLRRRGESDLAYNFELCRPGSTVRD